MSELKVEFEFEIGELVYFRGAQHLTTYRPKRFVICERIAHEYEGGILRSYGIGGVEGSVPEVALTREEPAFRPASDEQVKSEIRIGKMQRESVWKELDEKENAND